MEEGGEETNGALLAATPSPETRSGILVLGPVEPFPLPSWHLFCLTLPSVGYLRNPWEEDFPLIVIDSLGSGWPDSAFWDEGEVGGTRLPGGGASWLGLRVEVIPCR